MVDAARRNGTTLGVTENVRYRRNAAGAVPEAVRPDVDDAFMSTFELRNGGIGQVSFTWAGHGPPTSLPEGMVIYGSQGCLKGERLFRDGQAPITVRDLFAREASPAERERWLPLGLTDSFAAGFYDFLTAIERGGQPEASGEEGLRDLATAFALLESAAAGRLLMVNWPTAWIRETRHALALARRGEIGDLVQVKYRSAHGGPKEYGCSPYFYTWLYDGARNGAGAYMDYCCYGVNIARYLLGMPSRVTAMAGRLVKEYVPVDDNGVILMQYARALAIAEGSWRQG